jgi:hypothetical protein
MIITIDRYEKELNKAEGEILVAKQVIEKTNSEITILRDSISDL